MAKVRFAAFPENVTVTGYEAAPVNLTEFKSDADHVALEYEASTGVKKHKDLFDEKATPKAESETLKPENGLLRGSEGLHRKRLWVKSSGRKIIYTTRTHSQLVRLS